MPLEKKDKEILLSQSNSKTLAEWTEYFDNKYSKKVISSFIYHNNLRPKKISQEEKSLIQSQNSRKYNINQDYFKTWSRNMAYILGFWFADGCIYRGRMFDITIHKKDKYILKQIANELKYEGNLYDYVDRQASRLNFSCVTIYNDIVSLGGKENKSLDINFPEVPTEYLPDFIRGYFDGDGSICLIKNKRINTSFCSGSINFLNQLWDILKKEAGITGGSINLNNSSLVFGKRDSIKLGKYMYKDNPELFLSRKREKFDLQDKLSGNLLENPESFLNIGAM